jgi:hypothetical protein
LARIGDSQIRYYMKSWLGGRYRPSRIQSWLESLLVRILPSGNPDFQSQLDSVHHWWLEVDDNWGVQREIGFDDRGEPMVAAPLGENLGVFTDDDGGVELPVDGSVDPQAFERAWREFTGRWKEGR